ncbi:MAG: hypothetical protein WC495_05050 [Patescibacteria group bacterium]|jgi:hypothetical protein
MKKWELFIFLTAAIASTWFIKFILHFPTADISIIGVILSISSILFGLLAGFFFSELWQRYTEIRSLQSERSSAGLMLVTLATHFFNNKKFEKDFIQRMENTAIADETILWDEGDFEEQYYHEVAKSFELINVKNEKDAQYFAAMLNYSYTYSMDTIKADVLYKERLSSIEWLLFTFLSFIIVISVLLLDVSQMLYSVIVLTFPGVIFLTLSIIYGLNIISWSRNLITLEPNQVIFDALKVPRFYVQRNKDLIPSYIKNFRTEQTLRGEAKRTFDAVISKRKRE